MAAGLPVVASEVGGNSEAIDQGETGLPSILLKRGKG